MASSALFKHTTNRRIRPHTALKSERLGGLGPFDMIFKLWRKKIITNNCLSSPLLCEILSPFPKMESSYDRAEGYRWSINQSFWGVDSSSVEAFITANTSTAAEVRLWMNRSISSRPLIRRSLSRVATTFDGPDH